MSFLELIWLIPLFPAAGALLNGVLGKRLPKRVIDILGCGLVGMAFLFSLGAISQLMKLPAETRMFRVDVFTWISAGLGELHSGQVSPFTMPWGFQLDPLSAVMILVVTGVGFLIHIYSTGYMAHEGGYYRFFSYLNLFMFSMLTLVLANNFALMFVGWEGVGLCSYLLIGFYFHKKSAGDAGKKAFIVNRIGDLGFLLGMFLIFSTFGSLDFQKVFETVKSQAAAGHLLTGDVTITLICLLLFMGATGKSAQLPLYVWLPDAMEGPTPVSALIHAATMVTAGVYMVARCSALYVLAPGAMLTVAVVGGLTALFAASIGLVQNDIKRVLAYSTVSQLGYMFLGLGVGAFGAGIFHLMTHAFFKALLFLGSGSVIHALGGEQDLRRMGGLKGKIRTTWWTMMAGTLAIAGIPPLAGFFSKDEILWQAYASPRGHWLLWGMGAVAAGLTSFYMFRMMFLTFYGKGRMTAEVEQHVHESPRSMTGVLQVLAVGSVVAGWVGMPHLLGRWLGHWPNWFEQWLEPVFEHPVRLEGGQGSEGLEWGLMLVSVAIALAGWRLARRFYLENPALPDRLMTRCKALYVTLLNKYWVDEIYDSLVVTPVRFISTYLFWKFADVMIVDGTVNGVAYLVRGFGNQAKKFQSGLVRSYAGWILFGGVCIAAYLAFA